MNPDKNKACGDFSSLLIKRMTGAILPGESQALKNHLDQCGFCKAEERELTGVWQKMNSLPDPEVPAELYEKTRQSILGDLRRAPSLFPWLERIPLRGIWPLLTPVLAGLMMTGLSYVLIHNLVNPRIHHYYILMPLFSVWWMLFSGGSWLILKGKGKRPLPLDVVAACSMAVAFLTLAISFLTHEVDSVRWLAASAAYELAVLSSYLFGIGNTFVTAWWIHCCLASFVGAFIFGLHKSASLPKNAIVASFAISVLLFPAIYLQGSAHNHGLGIIAFAALGTYVGSLLGISLGLFVRRRLAFQEA